MKPLLTLTGALTAGALAVGSVAWATTRADVTTASATGTTTATAATEATEATASTPPSAPTTGDAMDHSHDAMDHGHATPSTGSDGDRDSGMGDMGGMGGDGASPHAHMDMSLPPLAQRQADATADQQAAADQLWAATRAAVAPYEDIDNALAAGFVPNKTQAGQTVVHYPNPRNRHDDHQLDPDHPEGLVYRFDPDGSAHLLGAVYTASAGEPAPTPAGPMFSWHTHDPSCGSFFVPAGGCTDTFRMLHVWVADGVVDPFTQPFGRATSS